MNEALASFLPLILIFVVFYFNSAGVMSAIRNVIDYSFRFSKPEGFLEAFESYDPGFFGDIEIISVRQLRKSQAVGIPSVFQDEYCLICFTVFIFIWKGYHFSFLRLAEEKDSLIVEGHMSGTEDLFGKKVYLDIGRKLKL